MHYYLSLFPLRPSSIDHSSFLCLISFFANVLLASSILQHIHLIYTFLPRFSAFFALLLPPFFLTSRALFSFFPFFCISCFFLLRLQHFAFTVLHYFPFLSTLSSHFHIFSVPLRIRFIFLSNFQYFLSSSCVLFMDCSSTFSSPFNTFLSSHFHIFFAPLRIRFIFLLSGFLYEVFFLASCVALTVLHRIHFLSALSSHFHVVFASFRSSFTVSRVGVCGSCFLTPCSQFHGGKLYGFDSPAPATLPAPAPSD